MVNGAGAARILKVHPQQLARYLKRPDFPKPEHAFGMVWFDRGQIEAWSVSNPPKVRRQRVRKP